MPDHVYIFDTTLRDGEQAPGASMTIAEKLEIARLLSRMGVDIIEAGFPISSPAQHEAVYQIAASVFGSTIAGLARANEKDVKAAADALKPAPKKRIHTFIATSDIHLDSKFAHPRYGATLAEKRQTILQMAVDAVAYAKTFTDDVEFSAEDAGRTDAGYLCDIIAAVVEAGATTINIPDTTGYCLPDEYQALFERVLAECVPAGQEVILSAHCHDDLGLAVANSLAAVRGGARQIECTINGIGERAGNAALEEVVMALRVRQNEFGVDTGVNAKHLTNASRLVSTYSTFPVQPNKAIVGKNAFRHEAGIHQDGVLKRKDTYEIMRAEDVGQEPDGIRLGRHSGRHGLFARLERLGIQVKDADRDKIYARFVEVADRKKEVFDEDLMHLVGQADLPVLHKHITLEQLEVNVATDQPPEASVALRVGGVQKFCNRASGDGPVDAVYRAIDHAVGHAYDLHSYTIRSVTEGQDALGEVVVQVAFAGRLFTGRAANTDILQASAEAYIDALNYIEAHRAEDEYAIGAIMTSYQQGAATW